MHKLRPAAEQKLRPCSRTPDQARQQGTRSGQSYRPSEQTRHQNMDLCQVTRSSAHARAGDLLSHPRQQVTSSGQGSKIPVEPGRRTPPQARTTDH